MNRGGLSDAEPESSPKLGGLPDAEPENSARFWTVYGAILGVVSRIVWFYRVKRVHKTGSKKCTKLSPNLRPKLTGFSDAEPDSGSASDNPPLFNNMVL